MGYAHIATKYVKDKSGILVPRKLHHLLHTTKLSGKLSKFRLMLFLWVTLHYQACNSMSLVLLIAGLGIVHFI